LAGIEEGEGIGERTLESKGVVAGRDAAEIETCSEEELKEFGTSLQGRHGDFKTEEDDKKSQETS
jgi:hypothetical protein